MVEGIQQLSAAMAAGDADAVEAFYRRYFDWLYLQARRATKRDEAFCLDVVQDAVLRVIRTVKAVESEPRFLSWLRLVVQTTAFDLLRNEKRRKNREAMAGTSTIDVDTDSLQLDWLAEQISALDPELVKIIELRFEQGWTLRRIGESLGISIGAVDGRLRRALNDLRLAAEESTPLSERSLAIDIEPVLAEATPAVVGDSATVELVALDAVPAGASTTMEVIEEMLDLPALEGVRTEIVIAKVESSLPAVAEVLVVEESIVEVEALEWVGLDDEAGAYDDRI